MSKKASKPKALTHQQILQVADRVYQLMLNDIRMNRERLGFVWKKRKVRG